MPIDHHNCINCNWKKFWIIEKPVALLLDDTIMRDVTDKKIPIICQEFFLLKFAKNVENIQ